MKVLGLLNILMVAAVIFGLAQLLNFFSPIPHYWIIVDFAVIIIGGISALFLLFNKNPKKD
jgi:hypothetical protein